MSRARRRIAAAVSFVCALVLLAGCSFGGSGKPTGTFAPPPKTGLGSYLETPPKGSVPGGSSWAKTYEPSTAAFLEHFYNPQVHKAVTKQLQTQGLVDLAHVLWITNDLVEGDVVVMQFSGPDGPKQRLASVQAAVSRDTTLNTYTITAPGSPVVYYSKTVDPKNNVAAKAYAVSGDYFVELFTFSPVQVEKGYIRQWLAAQIARLPKT